MLACEVGVRRACRMLGVSRATMHRRLRPVPSPSSPCAVRRKLSRTLALEELLGILCQAHSERFCDNSVRQIYATMLDEGTYLASISTMYRVLRAAGET